MRPAAVTLLLLAACGSPGSAPDPAPPEQAQQLDAELRDELLAMLAVDQEVREQAHRGIVVVGSTGDHASHPEHGQQGDHEHVPADEVHGDEMHSVDAANTARLKEIVAEHGWPGRSLVGRDGALAAFLIAQHADADPDFQRRCLELMRAAPSGEVSPGDVAYLTDRVRVNAGEPQLYGTQFWLQDGRMVPRPIEDPDGLDARREEAGLIPMSEYIEHMRSHAGH